VRQTTKKIKMEKNEGKKKAQTFVIVAHNYQNLIILVHNF
jgi:quinolinate synthase